MYAALLIYSWTVSTGIVYAVPRTPMPKVCAEHDRTIGTLQTIESTWNEVVRMYVTSSQTV